MRKLGLILAYTFTFIMMLLYFSPKTELYYTLEEFLKGEKIIFSDERVKDSGFTLKLDNSKLFYRGVYGGEIEDISFSTLLLYNSLSFKNAYLNSALADILPKKIEYLNIKYAIYNPVHITIDGKGDIGKISGYINPFSKLLHIELNAAKKEKTKYATLLRKFKPDEKGVLVYELRY